MARHAIAELRGQLAAVMTLVDKATASSCSRRSRPFASCRGHMKLAAAYARLGLYPELLEQLRDAARTEHDATVTKVMAEFNVERSPS